MNAKTAKQCRRIAERMTVGKEYVAYERKTTGQIVVSKNTTRYAYLQIKRDARNSRRAA